MLRHRLLLFGALPLVLLAGLAAWIYQSKAELEFLRQISALDLPDASRIKLRESDWGFRGGTTLILADIPEGFSGSILDSCDKYGYRRGPLAQAGIEVPVINRFVEQDTPYCFTMTDKGGGFDLVILLNGRLIVFVVG